MEATGSNTKSSPLRLRLLQLLLTLSSPAAASRVIAKGGKNKRVQLLQGDGAFQCRTCDRRFATFQALGGHRTSHKRPRVRAHGLDLLLGARPGKASGPVQHRCGTCGQTFATGQALGGHMRKHRPAVSVGVGAVETLTWTESEATTPSSSPSSDLSYQPDDDAWATNFIQFI